MGFGAFWLDLGTVVFFVLSLLGQAADRIGFADPGGIAAQQTVDRRVPVVAEALRIDLASQLGVDLNAVSLVSFETVTWSDGCLGVVVPGALCAQSLTPGFLAFIGHEDRLYRYQGSGAGFVAVDFLEEGASVVEPLHSLAPIRSSIRVIPLSGHTLAPAGRELIR